MTSQRAFVKNVVIIGAGMGGLATAIALRAQGINVEIYEQAKELLPIGAGITLFPNGLKTLAKIQPDLVDSLILSGSETQGVNLKTKTGQLLGKNEISLKSRYGFPMLNIRWSLLQSILVSALPKDIIHLNYRLIDFHQNDENVEVYFDNNKRINADLLIGADGLNSSIRSKLLPDDKLRYGGRMSWRWVIPYQHELLLPNEVSLMTSSDGKNVMLIDVGGGYIFASAGALSPEISLSENGIDIKNRVSREFADWCEPISDIIDATDPEDIVERPIFDRAPVSRWSENRVTLLGDAAHPMVPSLGQGANTAFEDGYILAQCLCHSSSIEDAIGLYEEKRVHRTQVIQSRSALQGSRAYDPDSDKYLQGVMTQAQMSNNEYEDWLYNYPLTSV